MARCQLQTHGHCLGITCASCDCNGSSRRKSWRSWPISTATTWAEWSKAKRILALVRLVPGSNRRPLSPAKNWSPLYEWDVDSVFQKLQLWLLYRMYRNCTEIVQQKLRRK